MLSVNFKTLVSIVTFYSLRFETDRKISKRSKKFRFEKYNF